MSRRSRFTDEFKKQIVALYKSGKRVADLAKDYEISKPSSEAVSDLVSKAKDIVFDETAQKTIKEFIMIVEEKNQLAKSKGETYLQVMIRNMQL